MIPQNIYLQKNTMGLPTIEWISAEYKKETAGAYDEQVSQKMNNEKQDNTEKTQEEIENLKILSVSKIIKEAMYDEKVTTSDYQFTDQETYTNTDFNDKTDTYINMNTSFRYIKYNIDGAGILYNQLNEGNNFRTDSPKKVFESLKNRFIELGYNKKINEEGNLEEFDIQNDQDILYVIGFFQAITENKTPNASKKDFRVWPKTLTAILNDGNNLKNITETNQENIENSNNETKNIIPENTEKNPNNTTEQTNKNNETIKDELLNFDETKINVILYSKVLASDYKKLFTAVGEKGSDEHITLANTYRKALLEGDQTIAGTTDDKKYPGIITFGIICKNLWQESIYEEVKARIEGKPIPQNLIPETPTDGNKNNNNVPTENNQEIETNKNTTSGVEIITKWTEIQKKINAYILEPSIFTLIANQEQFNYKNENTIERENITTFNFTLSKDTNTEIGTIYFDNKGNLLTPKIVKNKKTYILTQTNNKIIIDEKESTEEEIKTSDLYHMNTYRNDYRYTSTDLLKQWEYLQYLLTKYNEANNNKEKQRIIAKEITKTLFEGVINENNNIREKEIDKNTITKYIWSNDTKWIKIWINYDKQKDILSINYVDWETPRNDGHLETLTFTKKEFVEENQKKLEEYEKFADMKNQLDSVIDWVKEAFELYLRTNGFDRNKLTITETKTSSLLSKKILYDGISIVEIGIGIQDNKVKYFSSYTSWGEERHERSQQAINETQLQSLMIIQLHNLFPNVAEWLKKENNKNNLT